MIGLQGSGIGDLGSKLAGSVLGSRFRVFVFWCCSLFPTTEPPAPHWLSEESLTNVKKLNAELLQPLDSSTSCCLALRGQPFRAGRQSVAIMLRFVRTRKLPIPQRGREKT